MISITCKIILLTWLINLFKKQSTNLYCGIVGFSGFAGNTFNADKIKYLLHINQERGRDSTGIWDKKNGIQKTIEKAEDFVLNKTINWDEGSDILIGHCRAGSSGGKTVEQAHPHKSDNIIGVHNGTLRDLYSMTNNYNAGNFNLIPDTNNENGYSPRFKVPEITNYHSYTDSQLLYKMISGSKSTQVLSFLDGSAALLFHDETNPNILYAYRKSYNYASDDRPLFYGTYISKNKKDKHSGIYFSSINKALKLIGCENIQEVKLGHVCVFENGVLKEEIKINTLHLPNYYNNSSSYHNNSDTNCNVTPTNVHSLSPYSFESLKKLEKRWIKLNAPSKVILRDKWVYVHPEKTVKGTTHASFNIMVSTEDNETELHSVSTIDIYHDSPRRFFDIDPTKSVVIMHNITAREDDTLFLFTKGEVVKVIDVMKEDNSVIVPTKVINGRKSVINSSDYRIAEEPETLLYHLDNIDNTNADSREYCINKCNSLTAKERKKKSKVGFNSRLLTYYSENHEKLKLTYDKDALEDVDNTIEEISQSAENKLEQIFKLVDNSSIDPITEVEIKDLLCEVTENILILQN